MRVKVAGQHGGEHPATGLVLVPGAELDVSEEQARALFATSLGIEAADEEAARVAADVKAAAEKAAADEKASTKKKASTK